MKRTFVKQPVNASSRRIISTDQVIRGVNVRFSVPEDDYEVSMECVNTIIDMKDELAEYASNVYRCRIDPNTCRVRAIDALGLSAYVYFYVSADDYIDGRHITDVDLQNRIRWYKQSVEIRLGYVNIIPNVTKDYVWNELKSRMDRRDYDPFHNTFSQPMNDYLTRTSGEFHRHEDTSFSWSLPALFGRNYQFPQSGDFVTDLDKCYQIFDQKISETVPNFELHIDRQVDDEDDVEFEDVLKFKFSNAILKTRVNSETMYRIYKEKGSKGIISELLKLVGRTPNRVKIIRK